MYRYSGLIVRKVINCPNESQLWKIMDNRCVIWSSKKIYTQGSTHIPQDEKQDYSHHIDDWLWFYDICEFGTSVAGIIVYKIV